MAAPAWPDDLVVGAHPGRADAGHDREQVGANRPTSARSLAAHTSPAAVGVLGDADPARPARGRRARREHGDPEAGREGEARAVAPSLNSSTPRLQVVDTGACARWR